MANRLNKIEEEILYVMYHYGGGYCTTKLLIEICMYQKSYVKESVRKMIENELIKQKKIGVTGIYSLTPYGIKLIEKGEKKLNLLSLKKANESELLIIKKLKKLSYIASEFHNNDMRIAHVYSRLDFYENILKLDKSCLDNFIMNVSKKHYFDDIIHLVGSPYHTIFIALFPKDDGEFERFINDELIYKYYGINAYINSCGIKVIFRIVVFNDAHEKASISALKLKYNRLVRLRNNEDRLFYDCIDDSNQCVIGLDRFDVVISKIAPPHAFL